MLKTELEFHKENIELRKRIASQEKEIKRLKKMTDYDFLTGIFNRHGFIQESLRFMSQLREGKIKRAYSVKHFSLLFFDLDNMKKINDLFGHNSGDRALKSVALALSENVRSIDVVGRWGGDEFVVGLVNANKEQAEKVGRKLVRKIEEIKISKNKKTVNLSASFGIEDINCNKVKSKSALSKIIKTADKEMYAMKKKRKSAK